MENESIKAQAEKVIKQLVDVKEEFIKTKNELSVSIRKDEVSVELKTILQENMDYNSLKSALENYIDKLLIVEKSGDNND